jgi:uncharacterized metal-binding protein YceD (DUF177 family)
LGRCVAIAGRKGFAMTEIVTRSSTNPEFPRVVEVVRLRGLAEFAFDIGPTETEAAAIARLMDARSVRKMRLHGRLRPADRNAWALEATLGATAVQTCVVSLEPVTTRIDAPVRRLFTPDLATDAAEIVVDGVVDDEAEPLTDRIDLGLVAIEALALALPAYPRREGAALAVVASAPPGAAPLLDAEVRPFAALAALRGKAGDGA